MKSKLYTMAAAAVISIGSTVAVHAAPVFFNIELIATSGMGGSGSFSIDSTLLDAIPATGTFFSSSGAIDNFSLTIGSVVFDTVASGGGRWAASNGQVSGVTGLCCSTFTSSTTAGASLETNTGSGAPVFWDASLNGTELGAGATYTVTLAPSAVPLPAALPLMLVGLGGLAAAGRRRKAA